MKRLTKRYDTHVAVICENCDKWKECRHGDAGISECHEVLRGRLASYEDTGLEPAAIEQIKLSFMGKSIAEITELESIPIARLKELAQAEKDGRLVVLPVKIGDKVFRLFNRKIEDLLVSNVIYRSLGSDDCKILVECIPFHRLYWRQDFGKTVFLTREEAEAALKKRESSSNDK